MIDAHGHEKKLNNSYISATFPEGKTEQTHWVRSAETCCSNKPSLLSGPYGELVFISKTMLIQHLRTILKTKHFATA